MAVGAVAYAATALAAGALAAGGPRDRASASPRPATESGDEPERPNRFASLAELLYSRSDLSAARSLFAVSGQAARLDGAAHGHTLFLPVDRAFAEQQGVSDALARPENAPVLRRVIRFHVVVGRRRLHAGAGLPTLAPEPLAIRTDGHRWWAQDATIVGGPLRFPGGVAYLVDAILIAPGQQVPVGGPAIAPEPASYPGGHGT